jgi:hypothetical protein
MCLNPVQDLPAFLFLCPAFKASEFKITFVETVFPGPPPPQLEEECLAQWAGYTRSGGQPATSIPRPSPYIEDPTQVSGQTVGGRSRRQQITSRQLI